MIKRYKKRLKRQVISNYQSSEVNKIFSEKEFIIRSNGRMKVFKISTRLQWVVFIAMVVVGIWSAYSYQMYSVSDKIISYQEKKLDETRDAYVDLMSDFLSVHHNITGLVENINTKEETTEENIDEYLKKAQVIEEKIKKISARENWIDEEEINEKNALKNALIHKEIAIEEKKLLEEKVKHLEEVISSLQAFEVDILKRIESLSGKEMDKIKTSITTINKELKKRNKYFNPLANSKKDSKGGVFVPDNLGVLQSGELSLQATKTFKAVEDNIYYADVVKRVPIGKPVWSYWVSSHFGKRSDPFNSKSATHKGIDLASNKGNKIKTMASGTVTKSGWGSGYGKVIEIDHGNGFKTKYAHLNAIYVKKGEEVKSGQAIGEVGSTGRSTGPHLHYEILYEGVPMDPMVFMKAL
ncbi:MAG: peptidoglycan DD-metalloendopeptidase family protein [Alphaproteobacteria bacterium]|nr:peptidoglycan DD-metalloendopeptidase family protein [Alphaproteobacteria bacterium]